MMRFAAVLLKMEIHNKISFVKDGYDIPVRVGHDGFESSSVLLRTANFKD